MDSQEDVLTRERRSTANEVMSEGLRPDGCGGFEMLAQAQGSPVYDFALVSVAAVFTTRGGNWRMVGHDWGVSQVTDTSRTARGCGPKAKDRHTLGEIRRGAASHRRPPDEPSKA